MDLDATDRAPLPSPGRGTAPRWELYRLLADPVRIRLLALVQLEELAVGELAELLGEGQPKVSRHGAALRDAGLIAARRNGTWVLLKLADGASEDLVVRDALAEGRRLIDDEGVTRRVDAVIKARDEKAREYFARGAARATPSGPSLGELGAYLLAMKPLMPNRALAVDAGSGDGALLEVLGPVFDRVIAVDRSAAQLEVARSRTGRLGLANVDFVEADLDAGDVARAVQARSSSGADAVFAARLLHHAPQPSRTVKALADLLRPNGVLVVLDYAPHEDLAFKEANADLWLGFSDAELAELAAKAGLEPFHQTRIPRPLRGDAMDAHLEWTMLAARRL